MDNYIKTIINGMKTWVSSCLNRLEASVSKLSGNLDTLGSKITRLTSKVQQAQTTADKAQTTANKAQTTANKAQTTADNAQTTANKAQTTANKAQTTADGNSTAIYKATCDNGVLYICTNPLVTIASGEMNTCINAHLEDEYTSDGFFVWIAKLSTSSKILYLKFTHGDAWFDKTTDVNQGDIIRIYKGADDDKWKAELTGINLDYQALDAAYTEGVNSL